MHSTLSADNSATSQRTRLLRSSALVAGFFAVDKVVALVRSVIIARVFGVSPLLDAFNSANNLPDLLFVVISGGALAIAFIPVLAGVFDQHGEEAGWRLFSLVANLAFLVTAAIAIVVAIFAEPIVQFGIVPGFSADQQALVVQLMRLNLVSTLLFSISGLVIGGLQARQHFLLPALAPIMYNVGQVFGALVLAPDVFPFFGLPIPTLGLGVHGLVYGVILGAALHLGIQIPGLIRFGFRWTPALSLVDRGVLQVLALMAPRIIALGAFQFSELVRDNLASRLAEGSVTALTYGWFIMQVPQTVLGTAIGVVLLPTLATLIAREDWDGLRRTLTGAVRTMLMLTVPVAVALLWLTRPAVKLVFEGQAFTADATELVVFAAQMYMVGLVGHSLLEIGARTFYALRDAVTPTVVAIAAMALQIALAIWLMGTTLDYAGLALANSLAFTVQALTLLVLLAVRRGVLNGMQALNGAGLIGAATVVMALGLLGLFAALGRDAVLLQAVLGSVLAGVLFFGAAWLLRLPELRLLPEIAMQVLRRA